MDAYDREDLAEACIAYGKALGTVEALIEEARRGDLPARLFSPLESLRGSLRELRWRIRIYKPDPADLRAAADRMENYVAQSLAKAAGAEPRQ